MSTTVPLIEGEDLAGMTAALKEWPNTVWGSDEEELGVSPFLSFYFLYDSAKWMETSLLMVDIHEEFDRLTGYPYLIATHPKSERPHPYGSKRIPDLREFISKSKGRDFLKFDVTSEKTHCTSPANAGYFWKKPDYMNDNPDMESKVFSTIHLYYRWGWWKENREAWQKFIAETIDRLKPHSVYSGFSMANPLGFGSRSSITIWERALAPRFYGLDIDDPWAMDLHGNGIRPPTWAFFLSDFWHERLGLSREQVKDHLHHPRVRIKEHQTGLWIELGEEPSLYPVEDGVPELPVLLNRLIKPIRDDSIDLVGFPQWDGDPNERFNRTDAKRWLQRFDDDSDWPGVDQRDPRELAPEAANLERKVAEQIRAKAGEACPKSGLWKSVDSFAQQRHFEQGETMVNLVSAYGLTVWQFLHE